MDVTNKDTLDVMDENILKCLWSKNSLAFRMAIELPNMSILCFSKLDYYILDASVLNRVIIEQGVSGCLNFSVVEHAIQFKSF